MKTINKIDAKILKELLEDSSQHLSKIGKKVRLSRENVYYRIQNLIKKEIIRDFVAIIDYNKFGFNQYTSFIEFEKIDKKKEEEIIEYLKKQPQISWIGILAGSLSLTFDKYAKTNAELNEIINKFLTHFRGIIGDYYILNVTNSAYFFNKLINEHYVAHEVKTKTKIKIDYIDKTILEKLNNNSRITYVELANILNITPNAIKQRVKNLEKSGVIIGYSISINHKMLGFEWQGIQFKIVRPELEIEKRLNEYLYRNRRVIFYYQYSKSGICDFDIGIAVKNSEELREFVNELRTKFYEELKIQNIFLVLEEVSSYKLPKIIFS
jgi:DNA-binding Lrp family transcriptional regulator